MGENCYTGNILKTLRKRVRQSVWRKVFEGLMLGITVKPTARIVGSMFLLAYPKWCVNVRFFCVKACCSIIGI